MNDVYGPIFQVSEAEAADAELGDEHAGKLSDRFVFDVHTHLLKDDTRLQYFVDLRTETGKRGYNPELAQHQQTLDVKFPIYVKEVFLDSDTKTAVLSGAPSDIPQDWMLSNDAIREACDRVNRFAGGRRMLHRFRARRPGRRTGLTPLGISSKLASGRSRGCSSWVPVNVISICDSTQSAGDDPACPVRRLALKNVVASTMQLHLREGE